MTSSMPFQTPLRGAGATSVAIAVFIPAAYRRAFKRRPPG